MFSFFKKNKPKLITDEDEVYGTRKAADDALVNISFISEFPPIITSFFPASLNRMIDLLDDAGMNGRTIDFAAQAKLTKADDGPWLLNANHMTRSRAFDTWLAKTGAEAQFLFIEHYPLLRIERDLLDMLEEVSKIRPQRVRFFVGLDDPLMAVFGADQIRKVMKALGLAEDEKISHPMVNKAIQSAIKKLDEKIPNPLPADSVEEWFQRNFSK